MGTGDPKEKEAQARPLDPGRTGGWQVGLDPLGSVVHSHPSRPLGQHRQAGLGTTLCTGLVSDVEEFHARTPTSIPHHS